jgi:hypothetical protein
MRAESGSTVFEKVPSSPVSGGNEHLQPVPPDGSAGVIEGSAQQPWPTQETAPLSTAGTPD